MHSREILTHAPVWLLHLYYSSNPIGRRKSVRCSDSLASLREKTGMPVRCCVEDREVVSRIPTCSVERIYLGQRFRVFDLCLRGCVF